MSKLSIDYVLICHAPADQALAADLARRLRSAGIRAVGETDEATTENRVRKSAALLVLMTAAAERYDPIADQIEQARRDQIPVHALSVGGRSLIELENERSWPWSRGERLHADLVTALARAAGAERSPDRRRFGAVAAAAVVAATILVTVLVVDNRSRTGAEDPPPPAPSPSTGGDLSPGQVRIDEPVPGTLVDRCARVRGAADLPNDQTLMFAVNRTGPPSEDWYYAYVGAHQNGFVPRSWSGTIYFGSTTRQKYDLFVYVMDVPEAKAFWKKHRSKDGSYGFGKGAPPGRAAAHLAVTQGSTNEC